MSVRTDARYYEPTSGRFLSCDPMGQAASPSLYDFAGGDPVNFFDSDGRCPDNGGEGNPPLRQLAHELANLMLQDPEFGGQNPADPNDNGGLTNNIAGTGSLTTGNNLLQQGYPDTCFFASLRYAESQLGVKDVPTEETLVQIASFYTGRTIGDIENNGLSREEITPTLLVALLNGSSLTADVASIRTTADTYTANQQQAILAASLASNQVVIGSFYVRVNPTDTGFSLQTHAQAMFNNGTAISVWDPETGNAQSIGSTTDAYHQLVKGFQNNPYPSSIVRKRPTGDLLAG